MKTERDWKTDQQTNQPTDNQQRHNYMKSVWKQKIHTNTPHTSIFNSLFKRGRSSLLQEQKLWIEKGVNYVTLQWLRKKKPKETKKSHKKTLYLYEQEEKIEKKICRTGICCEWSLSKEGGLTLIEYWMIEIKNCMNEWQRKKSQPHTSTQINMKWNTTNTTPLAAAAAIEWDCDSFSCMNPLASIL